MSDEPMPAWARALEERLSAKLDKVGRDLRDLSM